MQAITAQLPAFENSDDKIFTTTNAVIMLDGASAFLPVPVSASTYADCLGRQLHHWLDREPAGDLRMILHHSIAATVRQLDLQPGHSPSSTVTITRENGHLLEILILGDSYVVLPDQVVTDDRMDRLDLAPRQQYRARLAAGHGYDDEHRKRLRELQTIQAQLRNRHGGYWIAEATPTAAEHAIMIQRDTTTTTWAVLATDGAYNTMQHLGIDPASLVDADLAALTEALQRCHDWEAIHDPSAQQLPRAKCHDDKSLAVLRPVASQPRCK